MVPSKSFFAPSRSIRMFSAAEMAASLARDSSRSPACAAHAAMPCVDRSTVSVFLCVFFFVTIVAFATVAFSAAVAFSVGASSETVSSVVTVGSSSGTVSSVVSVSSPFFFSSFFLSFFLSSFLALTGSGTTSTSYSSTTETSAFNSCEMPDESSKKLSCTLGRGSAPVAFIFAISAAKAAMPEMLYKANVRGTPASSLSVSSYSSSQTMSASC
mmetsp:Transcript_10961/g.36625  ORF Transcript_10961/g.36625 Transcript_10961/m.36625 type:complete len:214 (+) Transcript_10961:748-1389(+)